MTAPNFRNRTIWTRDNLDVLRGINSECVDLIYLDPPFNSNKTYSAPIGSKAAGAAFKDTWTLSDVDVASHGEIADREPALYGIIDAALAHSKGMKAYLIMMAVRLLELRRILKETGSIYLHCDPTASSYLRLTMDAVFGARNFRNEIVWCYQRWTGATRHFQRMHDVLLFYTKDAKASRFNKLAEPYSEKSKHRGRRHSVQTKDGLAQTYTDDTSRMKAMRDVWEISYLNSQSRERVGYPTQKPIALLDRVIRASTDPNDMVLDPFCGCATTLVAAERLNRRWAGIDLSPMAGTLVKRRLQTEGVEADMVGEERATRQLLGRVTALTKPPARSDLGTLPNYRTHKHTLFGEQEGVCRGCRNLFPFRNFTIDHVVPRSKGGSDHVDNLQLLCGACNSIKGDRPQSYLLARLKALDHW